MTKCKTQYKKTITIIIIIKIQDPTQVKEIKARVMEHKFRSGLVKGIGKQFCFKSGFKNGDGGRSLDI